MSKLVTACPICDSGNVEPFLERERVPVHQNLLVPTEAAALAVTRGRLLLAVCGRCGFVFNQAFDPGLLSYGEQYDNTQACSPTFLAYLDELAHRLVDEHGVRGAHVVEVGCGKGLFLRRLVELDSGNRGSGFDPSYVGPDEDLGGRLRFVRRFYDAAAADVGADVVVCRHVIEHVSRPLELLRSIRAALAGAPGARVFFETPCVEWILANRVIWDFFYEHCSYFSTASLRLAFEATGFRVDRVTRQFGEQYLWLEATLDASAPHAPLAPPSTPAAARSYARGEAELLGALRRRVRGLQAPVALWGAGAKGVTFAQLVDPDRAHVACVVDLNPGKQGKFLPGTAHPIVSYRDLPRFGVGTAVLLNPNYRAENEALLARERIPVRLLDPTEPTLP